MCINRCSLLNAIKTSSSRVDMFNTYEKIIPVCKGLRIKNNTAYIKLGSNEYEIKDDSIVSFIEKYVDTNYIPVVVEK